MTFQIADGYDQAGSLADASVQPYSEGIMYPDRLAALNGTEYDDGYSYTIWVYNVLTPTERNTLDSTFGVDTAVTNEVTIKTVLVDQTFANYNGIVARPINGREARLRDGLWHNVQYRIKHLEAL